MMKALSTAASGMDAQQTRLDVTSNNIANVSTTGFKKSRAEFQDLLYQTVTSPGQPLNAGSPSGLQVGMGTRVVGTQRLHTVGSQQTTSRPLDVAIGGDGFFSVTLPNGDKAYTRAGDFQKNADGHIVTADGNLLEPEITLAPDARSVTIQPDGAVMVVTGNSTAATEAGKIQLATFANPAGLDAIGKNLYRETSASGAPITGNPGENGMGMLTQGALEASNVSIVEEMVDLISGQRAYEVSSRVIKAADEMLSETANLK